MKDKIYSMVSFLFGLLCAGPAGYFIRKTMKDNNNKMLDFTLDKKQQTPEEAVQLIREVVKILEK